MSAALVLGAFLGALFAAAGMYVGALTGLVEAGNIAAALIGFALLGALRTRDRASGTVLVQTVSSSAGYMSLSGGFLGPVMALAMAGEHVSLAGVVTWSIALSVLGCLIAIPLYARLVPDDRLPFPTARATAEVIDTIGERAHAVARLWALAIAALAAAAIVVLRDALRWIPADTAIPVEIGAIPAAAIGLHVAWSPLLYGLGALFGVRLAVALALGSVVAWLVLGPLLVGAKIATADYVGLVNWLMWPGVGLMLGGAFVDLAANLWRRRATASSTYAMSRRHAIAIAVAAVAVCTLGVIVFDVHPAVSAAAVVLAALTCNAAARATGETDITPAGPLGGLAQVSIGVASPGGIVAPLTAGGVVNGTVMHASSMLVNWRVGRLVPTRPGAQLAAQMLGAVVGAITCALVFELLRRRYGFGSAEVPAPTALSWKATAEVVQHGISTMPRLAPLAAAIGLAVGALLAIAAKRAPWVPSPFALGIAFIVPPYIAIAVLVGALIAKALRRRDEVTIVSGIIAGEAITGVVVTAVRTLG